jgi:hypothetical protein
MAAYRLNCAAAFATGAIDIEDRKGMMMGDEAEFPKHIASWKCKPGDPNAKPMTLDEFVAKQRAEHGES